MTNVGVSVSGELKLTDYRADSRTGRLLNHVIRPRQHRGRDRQAKGLRGLQVDDQLELPGLFDRKITGLGAPARRGE
jgi:hypothetical protein